MSHFGVKVLCIEPGFFKTSVTDTNMIKQSLNKLWDRLPQDVKEDYGSDFLDRGNPKLISKVTVGNVKTMSET